MIGWVKVIAQLLGSFNGWVRFSAWPILLLCNMTFLFYGYFLCPLKNYYKNWRLSLIDIFPTTQYRPSHCRTTFLIYNSAQINKTILNSLNQSIKILYRVSVGYIHSIYSIYFLGRPFQFFITLKFNINSKTLVHYPYTKVFNASFFHP